MKPRHRYILKRIWYYTKAVFIIYTTAISVVLAGTLAMNLNSIAALFCVLLGYAGMFVLMWLLAPDTPNVKKFDSWDINKPVYSSPNAERLARGLNEAARRAREGFIAITG